MNRAQTRGVSLVQVLVVMVIVATLAGITIYALGPSSRFRAVAAEATADMRQIVKGIHLYKSDNDGGYPLRLTQPGKPYPRRAPESVGRYLGERSSPVYTYKVQYPNLVNQDRFDFPDRWDEARMSILSLPRFTNGPPRWTEIVTIAPPGPGRQTLKVRQLRNLEAYMDGRVTWQYAPDAFTEHFVAANSMRFRSDPQP